MSQDTENTNSPAAGPVDRPVGLPVRALRLTLELGADTRRDMAWALRNLADRIERDELSGDGVWGGPTDGGIWELLTDPTMTHERFFQELTEYLDSRKPPNTGGMQP